MGLDVRQLSLWEVNACWAGYIQAQGGEMSESLSEDEADELWRFIQ